LAAPGSCNFQFGNNNSTLLILSTCYSYSVLQIPFNPKPTNMKSINPRFQLLLQSCRFVIFSIVRVFKKWRYALLITAMLGLNSCFQHYYKTNTTREPDNASIQKLVNENKYFILHSNNQHMSLRNAGVKNDNLEADVDYLPDEHTKFLNPKKEAGNRFSVSNKETVLYEVHLYTKDSIGSNAHIVFPLKDFYRMDVYELDKSPTNKSKITSIVGLTLITAGVIGIIIGIAETNKAIDNINIGSGSGSGSSSSYCSPQLYKVNGTRPELTGILFSGAIFAPLQRTDFVPLAESIAGNDTQHLQIRSGANETLHLQQTTILQVTHNKGDKVLLDGFGKVQVYKNPVTPEKAYTTENEDLKKVVTTADENYYAFTNAAPGNNNSDIILAFNKPAGADAGKLVVSARNSAWALYVFKKYKSLYGEYYPTILAQKDKADPEKLMQCELDQSLPLRVSVKVGNDWKPAGYFLTPGNSVTREMIMNVDLAGCKNETHVEIKLETAYMFWELDYAGMDFSKNLPYQTSDNRPLAIVKKNGPSQISESVQDNITLTDQDVLSIDYIAKKPADDNLTTSLFLAGTGYYHDNSRFEGRARLETLSLFSHKGGFDTFSRQTFDELMTTIRHQSAKEATVKK